MSRKSKAIIENLSPLLFSEKLFIPEEFSWLQFNARVLNEAMNTHHPLLERLRFLTITSKNLDEFFMVKVAKLLKRKKSNPLENLQHQEKLKFLASEIKHFKKQQYKVFSVLKTLFAQEQIFFFQASDLNVRQKRKLANLFFQNIFPKLKIFFCPLKAANKPAFKNGTLYFSLYATHRLKKRLDIIFIEIPANLERFLVWQEQDNFICCPLEDVLHIFAKKFLPIYKIHETSVFRLLRAREIFVTTPDPSKIKQNLCHCEKKGKIIAIEIAEKKGPFLRSLLIHEQTQKDIFYFEDCAAFLQFYPFDTFYHLKHQHLCYKPYEPHFCPFISKNKESLLAYHPYDSFKIICDILKKAAKDKNVLSIKQTLYRTDKQSQIIKALIKAAKAGKKVIVILELRARFDEKANSLWAQKLRKAGVEVFFGPVLYKIHAKMLLIWRQEGKKIVPYTHLATGNYHSETAKLYTDLSYLTKNKIIGQDIDRLFNYLINNKQKVPDVKAISLSPYGLCQKILWHIENEIQNAKQKKYAAIFMKLNALTDPQIIKALYRASNYGVKIYLVIRGMCALKPQVQSLSENIFVLSIIGRFLEHSRFFCFANGYSFDKTTTHIYLSSADMMPRNLKKRIEILVPIVDIESKQKLLEIMYANLLDKSGAYSVLPSGKSYPNRALSEHSEDYFSSQDYFMQNKSSLHALCSFLPFYKKLAIKSSFKGEDC